MATRGRKPNDGRGRLGGRAAGTPNRERRSHLRCDRPELRGRRPNDGRGRLGGRAAGTENEATRAFDVMITLFRNNSYNKAVKYWRAIENPKMKIKVYLMIVDTLTRITSIPRRQQESTAPAVESYKDILDRYREQYLSESREWDTIEQEDDIWI